MQNTIEIGHLSRAEKLRIIEDIWDDLSRDETEVQSPGWHQDTLRKTKQQVDSGQETIVDWKSAKQELRKRFE